MIWSENDTLTIESTLVRSFGRMKYWGNGGTVAHNSGLVEFRWKSDI
jgi:hypothetical protein